MPSHAQASEIRALYEAIRLQPSLKPSPEINRLFSRLVAIALSPETADHALTPAETAHLQQLCSRAEYELELHWAKRIVQSGDAPSELRAFPYYANYEALTKLEWFTLRSCQNHDDHSVLFVGSGPLPLTAILLAQSYVDQVTILDYDESACDISRQLVNKLGLATRITVVQADAAAFDGYDRFNTIFIAALAGSTPQQKEEIMRRIKDRSRPHTHILARSSWGMREILYTPLDRRLYSLFRPVIEVRPHNGVVNSLVIFENAKEI